MCSLRLSHHCQGACRALRRHIVRTDGRPVRSVDRPDEGGLSTAADPTPASPTGAAFGAAAAAGGADRAIAPVENAGARAVALVGSEPRQVANGAT